MRKEKNREIEAKRWTPPARPLPAGRLEQDILDVRQEASAAGWDGYDALPVSERTCAHALQFAAALPLGLPLPEVCAEPDGSVCFDWYRDASNQISFSVGEDGQVSYAARLKGKPCFGSFPRAKPMPESIALLLRRVSE